jgi:hypothetical protein
MWQAPNNRRNAGKGKKRDRLGKRLHLKRSQGTITIFTQPSSIAVPAAPLGVASPAVPVTSAQNPTPTPASSTTTDTPSAGLTPAQSSASSATPPPPSEPPATPPPTAAPGTPEATATAGAPTVTPSSSSPTTPSATAPAAQAQGQSQPQPLQQQAMPYIPMLAYTYPARIILNDLSPKGVGIFSQQPFTPGMECLLTLLEPYKITIRGKTVWCDEVHHDSHILSSQPYSYRIGIEFVFNTPAEKEALEKLYQDLVKEHLGIRTAA